MSKFFKPRYKVLNFVSYLSRCYFNMKKLLGIVVLGLLLCGNAYAISKIAEDYDQFLDCKLTAIEIFQKGSKKSYTASQVEGVDIQRMTVHIKANV